MGNSQSQMAGDEKWTLLKAFLQTMSPYQYLNSDQDLTTAFKIYESVESFFCSWDFQEATSQAQKELESLETTMLKIAVTGETGAGKSSFINAIRGVRPGETRAAETGVKETTKEPTPYDCPRYPNVKFYDLPGIGSMNFKPKTYLTNVNFSTYDFFIIISSERFRSSHADLAREIQRMKKKFYFVRAKVDQDLENERKTHGNTYSEDDTLQTIREDCRRQLQVMGVSSPKVFLLSNWEIEKFDFHQLEDTLEQDLPHLKRLVFLLSLPNFSEEILKKKRAELKKLTFLIALASGGAGAIAIPVPNVSLKCNIQLLLVSTIAFYKHLGLDEESLSRTARWANLPVDELKGVMRSSKIEDVTFHFIQQAWILTAGNILQGLIGLIGMLVFAVCSFIITVFQFFQVVDELYADALRVRAKALGEENPGDSSGAVA
ncbi:T-cell-specific guanine nucleotide triphosphate-binding protein 1-like [Alligator sinensis]|uniref:T-cell-specific guanine nucleotide triphosphate-binding protein 1-like n=1 Tax=Alligator sinensis TaxID=38654 RepID=A0A3Q0HJV2_ALLSI|nr:T-cell-specific guanine nucleotide triphosphate-binding protein 1-like [Alligator sinensis]XP_025072241.1 T-cell-specific guanine nucleotide triphosphate-binding protein 1-like [Alligator sinensis]